MESNRVITLLTFLGRSGYFVLKVEEKDKQQGQIVMSRQLGHLQNYSSFGGVPSLQCSVLIRSGPRKEKW